MNLREKVPNLSSFEKLILLFIVIVLPLILFVTIALNIGSDRLVIEMQTSIESQMRNSLSRLEGDLERIQLLALDMLQDEDANRLAKAPEMYSSDYEKNAAIQRVQAKLSSIQSSSPYIANVRILLPSIKWGLNANGYAHGSYTEIVDQEVKDVGSLQTTHRSGLVYYNSRLLIPIVSYNNVVDTLYFVLEIEIDQRQLGQTFERAWSQDPSLFVLDIPEEQYTLSNLHDSLSLENVRQSTPRASEEIMGVEGRNMVFSVESAYLGAKFYQVIPSSELFNHVETFSKLTYVFFAGVVLCILVFFVVSYRVINKPLIEMVRAFKDVERGNFTVRLTEQKGNDFGYLYHGFNEMSSNLNVLVNEVYQQKMLLQKAELKQLQTQINPHFLYNSYFLLHRLIKKEDYEKAVRFSKEMGGYFRYITRNGADVVQLELENEHAKTYAEIQGMRFAGRIEVEYGGLPVEHRDMQVPRLILQPILENAFNYGLENKQADGILRVGFESWSKGLMILVEDNGEDMTEADLEQIRSLLVIDAEGSINREVTGLDNINRRVHMFFGEGSGLKASRSSLGGLKIELVIVKREE
ncbi:histidine kinase [Paenibacillus thiaminolyticus]|uniref:sensor histidine kinase n=1 Tax=Paenibacillus thiaminolyticus TaxID=49283 RepID=UPI0035A5E0A5